MCSCICTAVKVPAFAELHILFASFCMLQKMLSMPANQLVHIAVHIHALLKCQYVLVVLQPLPTHPRVTTCFNCTIKRTCAEMR